MNKRVLRSPRTVALLGFSFLTFNLCSCTSTMDGQHQVGASVTETANEADLYVDEFGMEDAVTISDPLRPMNRFTHAINDGFYSYALRPVSRVYTFIMPDFAETGVSNAFRNLAFPLRFVSNILQGRADGAVKETGKFLVNSTVGLGGLGNPAGHFESLETSPEDLGQAFGSWGIGHGPYLVLPLFGPSSFRDGVGRVGELALNPASYLGSAEATLAVGALEFVSESESDLDDYDALKAGALDPYESFKDAYIQSRHQLTEE